MNLLPQQIEFLYAKFFAHRDPQWDIPGAKSIAEALLVTGSCIVAGDSKIWIGGVGNFISKSPAPNAVGCSLLTFDYPSFLKSPWVGEVIRQDLEMRRVKLEELNNEFSAIFELSERTQHNQ